MTSLAERRVIIERLIDAVAASADAPEAYREAVKLSGALPVHCDMGGCLAIDPDGGIVEIDLEACSVRPVTDETWRRLALLKAARRYEELRDLRPQRPPASRACDACGGRGITVADLDCAACAGLGWRE